MKAYGEHTLSETYRDWFRRFKNNDFDVNDKERPNQLKKFENEEFWKSLKWKHYFKKIHVTLKELSEILNVDY